MAVGWNQRDCTFLEEFQRTAPPDLRCRPDLALKNPAGSDATAAMMPDLIEAASKGGEMIKDDANESVACGSLQQVPIAIPLGRFQLSQSIFDRFGRFQCAAVVGRTPTGL